MPPKAGKEKAVKEDEEIIQAVVLADSFNSRFKPLSANTPRALMPLCNTPLLDWTLECLISSGIQQVLVFFCSHAEQIKEAISASRWSLPNSGVRITPIVTPEARSVGDVMRELDAKQIITSDFILITGDVVSNLALMDVVNEHKARRKISKNCIMTMVMKPSSGRPRRGVDIPALLLNSDTQECLYYEYIRAGTSEISIPPGKISSTLDLDLRIDLLDCSIDICSADVPPLFTENFDYEDLRADFVHGVLTSDILGKQIYCNIPKRGYARRAKDTKAYAQVTHDVLSRRTFPIVPDDTPAYTHRRGNVYISDSYLVSRTCSLGTHTQVGPRSRIQDDAILDRAVIGSDCIIGPRAIIKNSTIWDGVHIGDGCFITDSIVGDGVRIGANSRVQRGSLIGENTVLGNDALLPAFSKVAASPPPDEDWDEGSGEAASKWRLTNPGVIGHAGAGGPQIEVYRWPGEGEETEGSDDEGGERETARSLKLNRLGNHDSDVDESDVTSVASLTPESTPSGSPASTAGLSGEDLGFPALSLDETGGGFSDADFRSECTQSLDRAFEEGHTVENAAIELKTLRMASNVPLMAVKEVITAFLVSKIPLKDGDATAQKKAVNVVISRWGALLSAVGSESPVENVLLLQSYCINTPERLKLFGHVLASYYNDDIVEDEDIKSWALDPRSKYPAESPGDICRKRGLLLLQAIQAQSSDEDDDSDE